jgi:hypothetical protein
MPQLARVKEQASRAAFKHEAHGAQHERDRNPGLSLNPEGLDSFHIISFSLR